MRATLGPPPRSSRGDGLSLHHALHSEILNKDQNHETHSAIVRWPLPRLPRGVRGRAHRRDRGQRTDLPVLFVHRCQLDAWCSVGRDRRFEDGPEYGQGVYSVTFDDAETTVESIIERGGKWLSRRRSARHGVLTHGVAMRDNLMGGLLAFGYAAPVVVVCCGGGTAFLRRSFGGIGAWLSGLAGLPCTGCALAFLVVRDVRRSPEAPRLDPITERKTAP